MKNLLVRLVRQSPAMIVAMLALFVALTGTAVATTSALITGNQIKNNSITGLDVKNRSLRPIDFRGSVRGPRGLRGLTGPAGLTGPTGPPGAPNPNAVDSDKLDGLDSTDFQKVPTTVQHLVLPGNNVIDHDGVGRDDTAHSEPAPGTGTQWCAKTGGGSYDAMPINLPQGAVITQFHVNYGDDSASGASNGSAWITRMPLFGAGSSYVDVFNVQLANTGVAGQLAAATDTTPSGTPGAATIDNTKHAYTVLLSLGAGSSICAVDISYTVAPGFAAAAVDPSPSGVSAPSTLP